MIKRFLVKMTAMIFAAGIIAPFAMSPMTVLAGEEEPYEYYWDEGGDVWEDTPVWGADENEGRGDYIQPGYFSGGAVSDPTITVGSTTIASVNITSVADGASFNVDWSTSNPGVATISGSGSVVTITGVGVGTAGINASLYCGGEYLDTCYLQVTVEALPTPVYVNVTGIQISQTSANMNIGDTVCLSANVIPSNANNKGVCWNSNNTTVATVDGNGYVRAVGSGSATITVRSSENGYPAYCIINVAPAKTSNPVPVRSVSLNMKSVSIGVGGQMLLVPTVYPDDASNKLVLWASSNPAVAAVDTNGRIIGLAQGSAIITCATVDGCKSASATVNVGAAAPAGTPNVVAVQSVVDPQLNYDTCLKIQKAKKNGTIKVTATSPMSFDRNVAAVFATRRDVKIECYFPFNGHNFRLTIPKRYNLKKTLNASGIVQWLDLCALNGKGGIVVKMLN